MLRANPRNADERRGRGRGEASRLKGGVTDDLIRFSVGIEEVEEVMADLAQVPHALCLPLPCHMLPLLAAACAPRAGGLCSSRRWQGASCLA